MDHNYAGTGTIKVGNCANYIFRKRFFVQFKVGSIAYSKPKALKGVLEKIVIKKIRLFPERESALQTSCHICTFPPMYIDTLNAYHNEEDLLGPEEAIALINNYNLVQRAKIEKNAMENC